MKMMMTNMTMMMPLILESPEEPFDPATRFAARLVSLPNNTLLYLPTQYSYHPNTGSNNTDSTQYSTIPILLPNNTLPYPNILLIPILSQTTLCSSVPSQYCLPNNTLTSQYCVSMLLMILQKHFVPFQNCSQTLKLKYFSANPILLLIILPNKMSYNIH